MKKMFPKWSVRVFYIVSLPYEFSWNAEHYAGYVILRTPSDGDVITNLLLCRAI